MSCDPYRLKKLEDLANDILSSASTTSATLDQLEGDIADYERSCTSLSVKEGEEMARVIKEKLHVKDIKHTWRCTDVYTCMYVHVLGSKLYMSVPTQHNSP